MSLNLAFCLYFPFVGGGGGGLISCTFSKVLKIITLSSSLFFHLISLIMRTFTAIHFPLGTSFAMAHKFSIKYSSFHLFLNNL